jgi:hypothetical protein
MISIQFKNGIFLLPRFSSDSFLVDKSKNSLRRKGLNILFQNNSDSVNIEGCTYNSYEKFHKKSNRKARVSAVIGSMLACELSELASTSSLNILFKNNNYIVPYTGILRTRYV